MEWNGEPGWGWLCSAGREETETRGLLARVVVRRASRGKHLFSLDLEHERRVDFLPYHHPSPVPATATAALCPLLFCPNHFLLKFKTFGDLDPFVDHDHHFRFFQSSRVRLKLIAYSFCDKLSRTTTWLKPEILLL
jgi:hypothetical protein